MADSYVQVAPDSTGKKLQTFQNTIGANDVEAEAIVVCTSAGVEVDPATETTLATLATEATASSIDGKITACNTGAVVISSGVITSVTNDVGIKDNGNSITVDGTLAQSTKHDAATYKTAFFNASADGDLVALVAAKVIKVHAIALQASGTVTVNIRSNNAAGTILSSWNLQAREGAVLPIATYPAYWFKTAAGEALYCDVTAAETVTINVIYSDADAT